MLVIRLPTEFSDATLPKLFVDGVLDGAGTGVLFLFDFARSDCWTGAPLNNAVIKDLSETGDAEWELESGSVASIAGNGLVLTSNTINKEACVLLPATVSASMYGAGTSLQHWMTCIYVKLPTLANWWTPATPGPIMKFAADQYTVGPEHFLICVHSAPALQLRRGTATGTIETISMSAVNLTPHYGLLTQIAAYRTVAGTVLRLRSSGGTTSLALGATAANSQNFGALRCQIGSGTGTWPLYGPGAPTIYRGWIEDLAVSGRTPTTVLNADYTRTISRLVFT